MAEDPRQVSPILLTLHFCQTSILGSVPDCHHIHGVRDAETHVQPDAGRARRVRYCQSVRLLCCLLQCQVCANAKLCDVRVWAVACRLRVCIFHGSMKYMFEFNSLLFPPDCPFCFLLLPPDCPAASGHCCTPFSLFSCRVKGPMGAFYSHSGKSDPMAGGHP